LSLLRLQSVVKSFGGLTAINNVSFDVAEGEIVGLIGPNGAGKTTVFNVINGFFSPTKGDIYFRDRRISGLKPHKVCRMGIARTFQVVKPLQRLSVMDNVMAAAFTHSMTRHNAMEFSEESLSFCNLLDDRNIISKALPLGKRKRLEIARALATRPELLLLDESFAGLNPSELNESIKIIKGHKRERHNYPYY